MCRLLHSSERIIENVKKYLLVLWEENKIKIKMKNLGFKQDANWLQDVLPHDHMYEPSFLGNRAWLMKAERPTPTKSEIKNLYEQGFDVKTRDNSPTLLASAPYFAAFQTEIFSYFPVPPTIKKSPDPPTPPVPLPL